MIWDTLHQIVQEGFDRQLVNNMVGHLEMSGRFPDRELGLGVIQSYGGRLLSDWDNFGEQLRVDQVIKRLRKEIAGGLLEKLVQTCLVDNAHRVQVVMRSQ